MNGTSKEKARLLETNVCDALSSDNLTIERTRKFVRQARDYQMVYQEHFKTLDLMQSSALATTAEEANKDEGTDSIVWIQRLKSR
jgi:hypothetical protein